MFLCMFSLIGKIPDPEKNPKFTIELIQSNSNMFDKLFNQRTKCSADEFTKALDMRECKYAKVSRVVHAFYIY